MPLVADVFPDQFLVSADRRDEVPGGPEVLTGELDELGVNPTELSPQIRLPANRISQIINGKCAVTRDITVRFGYWFGTSPPCWVNLRVLCGVRLAKQEAVSKIKSLSTKHTMSQVNPPHPVNQEARVRNKRSLSLVKILKVRAPGTTDAAGRYGA